MSSSEPVGLFDVPEPVLWQIISASKGVSHSLQIHPLLQVCRQGRDAVLRWAKRIKLGLSEDDLDNPGAIAGLLSRARQLSQCIELSISGFHTPDSFFAKLWDSCKDWASVQKLCLQVGCLM
jgi:hypothetical protein